MKTVKLYTVSVVLSRNGEEVDRLPIKYNENLHTFDEADARSIVSAVSCAIEETGLGFVEAVLHWIADGRKPETRPIGL